MNVYTCRDHGGRQVSEMVERVARAIADCGAAGNWDRCLSETVRDSWRAEARAAIAAMREPTVKMIGAAQHTVEAREARFAKPIPIKFVSCKVAWQAMVDEALR